MEYELVHEIQNHCPSYQMRDVFIREAEADDPEGHVRNLLRGDITGPDCLPRPDGVTIHAVCDRLRHISTFST